MRSKKGISFSKLVGLGLGFSGLLNRWLVLVKLHESGEIELWLLEDLDLSNHAVVAEWVDLAALLLDLFANLFFNTIKYKFIINICHTLRKKHINSGKIDRATYKILTRSLRVDFWTVAYMISIIFFLMSNLWEFFA